MTKTINKLSCMDCATRKDGVFCNLTSDEIKKIDDSKHTLFIRKGEVSNYKDVAFANLYCVAHGKLFVQKPDQDGDLTVTQVLNKGDILGLQHLFDPRSGEEFIIEALEDCQICSIDAHSIADLVKSDSYFSIEIIKKLSEYLSDQNKLNFDLKTKELRERFITLLNQLADKDGELSVQLTREEMARWLGTAPETLMRLVSDLKSEGIISVNKRKITLNQTEDIEE